MPEIPPYEEQFAHMPDEIGSGDAAVILNVTSTQGVVHILNTLPEDAPQVAVEYVRLGKRRYRQYSKSEIIALRRYRDAQS